MNLATSTKKLITTVTAFLVAVILAVALCFSAPKAVAEETINYANWHENVTVTNSQFAETGSETVPLPTGWTNSALGGANSVGVIAGVMDLDSYSSNKETYKLDQYSEYELANPDSPFGTSSSENDKTNRKVLLINANGIDTAYGFKSSEITLAGDSYYKLTAWVKTGGHSANGGASIIVDGVTEDTLGFTGIRTPDLLDGNADDKGWFEYTIFFATAYDTTTATISLQLGHDGVGGLTKGYAMFDNVNLVRINSSSFENAVESLGEGQTGRKFVAYAYNDKDAEPAFEGRGYFVSANPVYNESTNPYGFGSVFTGGKAYAETTSGTEGLSGAKTKYGADGIVYQPSVSAYSNTFVVSTYNGTEFEADYAGIKSIPFEVKRFASYRLSVWFYAEHISLGGVNATIEYATGENEPTISSTALSYTAGNPGKFGWQEAVILIKGSDFADYTANLVLSIGTKNNEGSGVAFFDDITLFEIPSSEYETLTENATHTVAIDTATDNTGVNNGWFNNVGTTTEKIDYSLDKPLPVKSWTMKNTAQVGTSNFSNVNVPTSDAVHGLVKAEDLAFVPGFNKDFGNALKLSSTSATAYCYASEGITLTADSYNTIAVTLFADDLDGYGANLVIKQDAKVVGTIEKITKSGTYTFYIKNGKADSTVYLELWLGLNDRVSNASKLASGSVYFTSVNFKNDSTAEIFDAKAESYKYNRANAEIRNGISYAVIDLTSSFTQFDSYTTGSVKVPYNWSLVSGDDASVVYGIFDANNREGDSTIPYTFDNKGKQYAVMLQNVTPTYSTLTLDNAFGFTAKQYYKISVSVKTDIPEEYRNSETAVGASVYLTVSDNKFFFKNTSETIDSVTDNEVYRTFVFFVKAGESDLTANLVIGLGDKERTNQYTVGRVYLNDITVEDMSEIDYSEKVKGLSDSEYLIDTYTMRVDLAEVKEETPETEEPESEGSLEWWLIPSILLAVAVVIAVVGTIIRKFIEKRPTKPTNTPSRSSYDRRALKVDSDEEEETTVRRTDMNNDSFDDFDDEVEATEVEATEVETTEEEATEEVTEETAEEETTEEVTEETTEEVAQEVSEEVVPEVEATPAEENNQ